MKSMKEKKSRIDFRFSLLFVGILALVIACAVLIPTALRSATGGEDGQPSEAENEWDDAEQTSVREILTLLSRGGRTRTCDLNGDGSFDVSDVTTLLNRLASPPEVSGRYSGAAEGTVYHSPASVAVNNGKIFVADATGCALYRLSTDGTPERTLQFDRPVNKAAVFGGRLYVLLGESSGELRIYNTDFSLVRSVPVGHTPTDLWVSGSKIYVCCRFSNDVYAVNAADGALIARIGVSREPCCMAAAGGYLYVGSRMPDGSSLDEWVSAKITKINMSTNAVTGTIALQDGASNIRGMAASPDGTEIYVTHTVARYSFPTTQLDRGWVNTNGFSIIDTASGSPTAFLLDDLEKGAANPWDVEVADGGNTLWFTISGTGELIKLDLAALKSKIAQVNAGQSAELSSTDRAIDLISFLSDCKNRTKLSVEGARDLAVSGDKIYVCGYFSGNIALIDAASGREQKTIRVAVQPEKDAARAGEALWCDATYCYQSWESCSSCHPDARPDGFNWDEGGDGWGTPKNTKSMIFSMRTPPVLATGCVDSAEDNVMGTVREAFRSRLSEEKIECINAYLRSLLPVESPYLTAEGRYSEAALRGEALFSTAGCAVCHPAPLYTDLKFHYSPYLGSDGSTEDRAFITPTLVELWRSAPYTYSGCVTDLKNLIRTFSSIALTDGQVSDIEQFLLSIGVVREYYGAVEFFAEKEGRTLQCVLQPGSTITAVSVIKQIPSASGVSDPTVTVRLCLPSGAEISKRSFSLTDAVYGQLRTADVDISVPADLPSGSYLQIDLRSDMGAQLATPYRVYYRE